MEDGNWVKFDSWRTNPEKVKSFLTVFEEPSLSPKPTRVLFILKNGSKAELTVSNNPGSKKELDKFIKHLRL